MSSNSPTVSVIVPVFNEAGNIQVLIDRMFKSSANSIDEVICVNDGSTDETADELQAISSQHKKIKVITLARNFGQTAALAAGIDHAQGDIIIPMDADGQNDPIDIANLLTKMKEGFDVVSGWRRDRQDAFFSRILPSKIANALISMATGVPLHDYGCTLKAYRRAYLKDLQICGEMHRFLPAWCAWQGAKVSEIVVQHHPRRIGKSNYGFSRFFKVIIDLFTVKFFQGFLFKPNYLFSGYGLFTLVLSGTAASVAIIDKFGPDRFPQFRIPLLLLAVFLGMVSVFLFLIGVLAEVLARLYFQVRNQKPYRLLDD